ncbi:MAG: enolase C-terminal domain-like protein [Lachnospirales bacterium]
MLAQAGPFIETSSSSRSRPGTWIPWLRRTRHSPYPIMADESVESYEDAQRVLAKNACDYINIKLMKTGGLSEAQKINDLAESRGGANHGRQHD